MAAQFLQQGFEFGVSCAALRLENDKRYIGCLDNRQVGWLQAERGNNKSTVSLVKTGDNMLAFQCQGTTICLPVSRWA